MAEEFAGINIDPASWEDPKQSFPGEIVTSEFRMASDKYREATQFRPAITEPLPQWNLIVKRLDATRQKLDASYGDVIYYGGVDMKRFSARANDGKGGLVPLSSGYPKEWEITNCYKKTFGTVQPPTVLVGKKAMFDFYATRSYGSVSARRILLPASILPPDYAFVGEKVVFIEREREDGDKAEAVTSPNGATDLLSEADAMELIPSLLVGQRADDIAALIEVLPQNARLPNILTAVATGDLLKQLEAEGKLTIDATGLIGAK